MVVRAVAALSCATWLLAAMASETRKLSDQDVITSQRESMLAWRNHCHKRDASYCGQAYVEDASMYGHLGPAASVFLVQLHLADPMILRGREAITEFWSNITLKVGLHDFVTFEDDGEFLPKILVVNDEEVTVAGKFSFNALQGHTLSQTWIRNKVKDTYVDPDGYSAWKIKTHMFSIESVDKDALEAMANTTVRSEEAIVDFVEDGDLFREDAPEKQGGHGMLIVGASVLCAVVACFVVGKFRQGRNSYKYAEVKGLDSMLG